MENYSMTASPRYGVLSWRHISTTMLCFSFFTTRQLFLGGEVGASKIPSGIATTMGGGAEAPISTRGTRWEQKEKKKRRE